MKPIIKIENSQEAVLTGSLTVKYHKELKEALQTITVSPLQKLSVIVTDGIDLSGVQLLLAYRQHCIANGGELHLTFQLLDEEKRLLAATGFQFFIDENTNKISI